MDSSDVRLLAGMGALGAKGGINQSPQPSFLNGPAAYFTDSIHAIFVPGQSIIYFFQFKIEELQ
jgi:hypothetical protein